MKNIFLFLFFVLSAMTAKAQSVADLWVSMPQKITPYLSMNQKKEMIESWKIGVDTNTRNVLEGLSSIDTLSNDYGRFVVSSSKSIEIIRLSRTEADSMVCVIVSYSAPKVHSSVAFYSKEWKLLATSLFLPRVEMADLVCKPDTMSTEDYDAACKLVSPFMVRYHYNPDEKSLEVTADDLWATKEEKEKLNAILCERKLKWRDGIFK